MVSTPDYSLFRSLIEYSYPKGGNGSVIFETPPRLNAGAPGQQSTNTLTFTCQTILSDHVDTQLILIHLSVNPDYSRVANYDYVLHSMSGEPVASGRVAIGPFAVRVLNIADLIPPEVVERERAPIDGISPFTFVGCSDEAALLVVIINSSPSLDAVAVEHTHPSQAYLFSLEQDARRRIKADAQAAWKSILSKGLNR